MSAKTSPRTHIKMAMFRRIMDWHITITDKARGVFKRNRWLFKQEYLYIDLYAGPGHYDGPDYVYHGPGSPVIAIDMLNHHRMPHAGVFFNKDSSEVKRLQSSVGTECRYRVICDDNANALDYIACHRQQFGLAYFDPNTVRFDWELGKQIAECSPKIDLLFFASASAEKRCRRASHTNTPPIGEGGSLVERMKMIGKNKWFVLEPFSKHQYTFIAGTNAKRIGDWKKIGWHDVDSDEGARVLDRLNLTNAELKERHAQMALPL